MPLCLIQSLPGTKYALTEALSVVVPTISSEWLDPIPLTYQKRVKEGRAAWHTESVLAQDGDSFSYEQLANLCSRWREKGIFSFVEVHCCREVLAEEKKSLSRLAQMTDWLILDATSPITFSHGVLRSERGGYLCAMMKEIGTKVGLRLTIDPRLPVDLQAPWIAKTALSFGAPGFLFIDSDSNEKVTALVRLVQDMLSRHPYSQDSARLIPLFRPMIHTFGDTLAEVLDFSLLDALLIESFRPFFGGVAVSQTKAETVFDVSMGKIVQQMLCEGCSSTSFLSRLSKRWETVPVSCRTAFVRAVYDLLLWVSKEDYEKVAQKKKELELVRRRCVHEMAGGDDGGMTSTSIVTALLEHSSGLLEKMKASSPRQPSFLDSFLVP